MTDENFIPVAAPVNTDSAGSGGKQALQSVFRIICRDTNSSGTCFLHKSGNLLTAEHVIRGSSSPEIMFSDRNLLKANIVASKKDIDLAILSPTKVINTTPLDISNQSDFSIGTQVSTWGFPDGYMGGTPMLSVGHLSALTGYKLDSGSVVYQWVVNAAFNSGNSGGPLLHIESGSVMGVVSSKLAPINPATKTALEALQNQQSGLMYTATQPDGTTTQISEGQVIAAVLNDLRKQTQLVIGMAVLLSDVRSFLESNQMEP